MRFTVTKIFSSHLPFDRIHEEEMAGTMETLKNGITSVLEAENAERILGIEGICAHRFFSMAEYVRGKADRAY